MQSHDKSYATAVTETFTLRRILVSGAVNGVVLLWLALDPRSALTIDQADIAGLGNPQPFLQSTEIAAALAVPLLIESHKRPDNPHQYERIEQFSEDTDYDHLDAVFWDLAAMVSDIRPTTATLLLRNYLMYLMAIWLFSALLSVYHGNWLLHPTIFATSASLLFSYRTQTLFTMDYPIQGMVTVAPVLAGSFCMMLCQVFRHRPQTMRYWLAAFLLFAFFLRYISVIHSANRSVILIVIGICAPLFFLRFARPTKTLAQVLVVSLLGVAGFDLFVEGLREYRDRQMGFEHERPQHANHATFSMVYLGIGVFENSLGIDDTDKFVWNRDLIEAKASELGVAISKRDRAIIGGAPKADQLYFRMWMKYVSVYPWEYLKNRVKANAWIIARMALRDIYPLLSTREQIAWCVVAIVSWVGFGALFGVYLRFKPPLESVVIFVAGFIALSLMGILWHPVRGVFAAMPAALAVISAFALVLHRVLQVPNPKSLFTRGTRGLRAARAGSG
jgi:hypothetical protein